MHNNTIKYMNTQNNILQFTSLELSKKLKMLGVPQKSLFYWSDQGEIITEEEYLEFEDYASSVGLPPCSEIQKHFSAYILSELEEYLSKASEIIEYSLDGNMHCAKIGEDLQNGHGEFAETEVNAKAQILIHLLMWELLKL